VTFDINGIVGALIDLPFSDHGSKRGYSLASLPRELPVDSELRGPSPSLSFFSAIYIALVFIGPSTTVLAAFVEAITPPRWRLTGACRLVMEYALAWCGLDVLALAAVAGWWQIDLIGQWLIDDQFGEQCNTIHKDSGKDCITVATSLNTGFWWLLSACAIASTLTGLALFGRRAATGDRKKWKGDHTALEQAP